MKGPTAKFLHNPAGLIDQRDPKIQSAKMLFTATLLTDKAEFCITSAYLYTSYSII